MTAAVRPAGESAPHAVKISPATASAPLPLIGRSSMSGTVSAGMPRKESAGRSSAVNASIAPEARSALTAGSRHTSTGAMRPTVRSPWRAPSVRAEKTSVPRKSAYPPTPAASSAGRSCKSIFMALSGKAARRAAPRPRPPQTISTPRAEYRTHFPRRRPSAAPRRSSGGAGWTRC